MCFVLFSLILPRQIHKVNQCVTHFIPCENTHLYEHLFNKQFHLASGKTYHEAKFFLQTDQCYAASELPHVWVGKLDADQGLVNQQVFACKTCLEQVKRRGLYFFPLGNQCRGMKCTLTNSPSLGQYEDLVLHDQFMKLQMNSFNYTCAEIAAPGIFISTRKKEQLSQRSGIQ